MHELRPAEIDLLVDVRVSEIPPSCVPRTHLVDRPADNPATKVALTSLMIDRVIAYAVSD